MSSQNNDTVLRDGFQEVQTYHGHKRPIRGCRLVSTGDDDSMSQDVLVSWDSNCIRLWEKEKISRTLRFPKNQECYINSIIYIAKLNGETNTMIFMQTNHL